MVIRKRITLDQWINEALLDTDKDGKCTMISLVHMQGSAQKEIHTTRFGGGKTWEPKTLADMFQAKAENYCQDLPGVQTFQLLGFYKDRTTPEAFMPFTCGGKHDFDGLNSEPPTPEGRLAMTMRNEQTLFSQVYRRQQQMDEYAIRLFEAQSRHMQDLMSTNRELVHENRDAFVIVKDMLMQKALDTHAHQMAQLKYERDSAERKKWISYLPLIANTVLGREVFPQSTADTVLVESIADKLDEESIMKLAAVIPPELMGPLANRMQQYLIKKQEEENQLKALAASATKVPDPEAEAGGDPAHTPPQLKSVK